VATIPDVFGGLQGTLDPANGDLYVPSGGAANGTQNLTVISTGSNSVIKVIDFGEFANLQIPSYDPANGLLYVADDVGGNDTVEIVNGSTNSVVGNVSTGFESSPMTGLYDPINHDYYVPSQGTANFSSFSYNLTVIDTLSNSVAGVVHVGVDPQTPALDPSNGDLYVPNEGSNNLSIVATSTNQVVGTIGGLGFGDPDNSYTPLYDPSNGEIYVPDPGSDNLTVLSNTSVVASIHVGTSPFAPALDPANGEVDVSDAAGDFSIISPTTNTVVASASDQGLTGAPVYDPLDNEVYAPGTAVVATGEIGIQTAFDPGTAALVAIVNVGDGPSTGTLVVSDQELYSVNGIGNNVSVIAVGPSSAGNAPETYSVTFTVAGLPGNFTWAVQLNGTTQNRSVPEPIVFSSLINDSYSYSISDQYEYYDLVAPNATGQIRVHGASQTIEVMFKNLGSAPGKGGSGATAGGFLGLAGGEGYLLVAAVGAAVIVGIVLLALRSRTPPTP
jgi:YVTN family beta-propeller protein